MFLCFFLFKTNAAQDSLAGDRQPAAGIEEFSRSNEFKIDSVKISGKKKKWVAALLAFPLFGITGAHRIYLGTEPYMPLVYLATLGGFGILPLVDFIVILCTPKDKLEEYFDNGKVFMWGK